MLVIPNVTFQGSRIILQNSTKLARSYCQERRETVDVTKSFQKEVKQTATVIIIAITPPFFSTSFRHSNNTI
jgi:hypothetical protein